MYNFRRILVPTDFSEHAQAALEHAVVLGARYKAEITLLHVDEFSVLPMGALAEQGEYIDKYQARKREFFEDLLGKLTAGVNDPRVRISTEIKSGRAYKVIIEEGEAREYDLIVIATHGLTPLSPHLIGSTAERVVRLSRTPVLSVHGRPQRGGKVRSILCPTDLSQAANVAVSYAWSIAVEQGATLYVQYVSELEKPEREREIRDRMPALLDQHPEAHEVKVNYVFDRDVDPSNSIIRFALDREIDLIVMSTHGRKGLRRVFIGNNTAEVVRQSVAPVLTVAHPLHKTVFAHPATEPRKADRRWEKLEILL
jgi:nucleotide-binding universal stress UspA family protein